MKISIKSNKGVTITGLVIYVSSFLMICGVIAVITTFFYNNTKFLSSEATASSEYDILNAYLAKEAKTEDNTATVPDGINTTIQFSKGNQYIFEKESAADYGQIYLCNIITNKYFIVANYVQDATFDSTTDSFTINIKILGKTYTQTYNLAD